MLKLPAFRHFQFDDGRAVTVFQDDAKFWRFYMIPDFPQVRQLPNGDPVFLLVEYAMSDRSRSENPELARGGGYLVFDAELRIETEHKEHIVGELQTWVEQEWERLIREQPDENLRRLTYKSVMNDSLGPHWLREGHHGSARAAEEVASETTIEMPSDDDPPIPTDAPAPEVEVGLPLWSEGTVKMTAPQSSNLVRDQVAERKASLVGNNVAAFAVDLTEDGAVFMRKTLIGEDGSGATDLTPIQVEYNLTMLAKLPPATMFISFKSADVYHALQELFHEHDSVCSDDYFTSETMMTTAISSGLLTVKVDMGGITDEDMQELLMQQAMQQARQLLVDRFASKERAPLEEWADEDLQNAGHEVYRLKRQQDVEMIDFQQTMEIVPTMEYTIAPQGTLATFLRGRSDMDAFVRQIDLDDDFFKTLQLRSRAFANWEEDAVAFVEIEVKYEHEGQTKTDTFTFTPAETEPQEWDPSLIGGNREYEYRYRVAFEGQEAGPWTEFQPETTRDLNVAVPTPGKLDVTVTGAGLNFEDVLVAALVHLSYEDGDAGVGRVSHSVLLTAERQAGEWQRMLYAPWTKPVRYRIEYLLKTGTTVVREGETDGPSRNLLVPPPDIDMLNIALVPAGDWSKVVQSAISLRYESGDYHRDQSFIIKSIEDYRRWDIILLDPNVRTVTLKVGSTFQDGSSFETEWMERDGDQAVLVVAAGPPRMNISVTGISADFVSTPVIKVDLEYEDPDDPSFSDTASYSLQGNDGVEEWAVDLREGGPTEYRYQITYFPAEGDPVVRDWETTSTELIVVPRYSVPKVGADFRPVLQDFTKTPAVDVATLYEDADRGVRVPGSLVFTAAESAMQSWYVTVPDTAPRAFSYTVTWFYASGAQVVTDPVTTERSSIVIPPAPPEPAPSPPPTPEPEPTPTPEGGG